MTISAMLYKLLMGPLELLFDVIYALAYRAVRNPGLAIIFLSLAMNLLVLPLYRRADALQEEERALSKKMERGVRHIKKTFKGDERFMMLQTYYRQNHYKPYYALKGSLSLLLEIPFFIAAYRFLSGLRLLQDVSFGPIRNLAMPDGLLRFGGFTLHLLPILMTGINIVSGAIYTHGMPLRSKIQLYGMALIFLFLLYDSPSGLVFYWTLNNLFSLVKNIFYKLRNPRRILSALCTALGLAVLAMAARRWGVASPLRRTGMLILGVALQLPLCAMLLKGRFRMPGLGEAGKGDRAVFMVSCVVLTALTGLLIPSAILRASPAEFMDISTVRSPVWHAVSSGLLAAGAFLIWFNIFYHLANPAGRRWFSLISALLAGGAALDYMAFGKDYGTMSAQLKYDLGLRIPFAQTLINAAALLAAGIVIALLWKKRMALLRVLYAAAAVATVGMSAANLITVQAEARRMAGVVDRDALKANVELPLDRTGKNVIVLMLDRAISRFVPFLLEEKPELQRSFAGFTYYPNTMSYGAYTNVASPALFGGYDYIPEEMNARADERLVDKHNEALKVMPRLFLDNGYEVTLCDPTYAGYDWVPDLTVFDDMPEAHRYITMNESILQDEEIISYTRKAWDRNFFCHGIFRSAPLVLQSLLYDGGAYNTSEDTSSQLQESPSVAHGFSLNFLTPYQVLLNLPEYTQIRDTGAGSFLMLCNDTTHEPMLLSEPDYTPAETIDNTAYDAEHAERHSIDGQTLRLETENQMQHYHTNMATLLRLGEWFDAMRAEGIYDNTRIILVSDHGRDLDLFGMKVLTTRGSDLMFYNALLMVKDFDSNGEFVIDGQFMTNADTPSLALADVIEDPVNPFTGRPIDQRGKEQPEQHVAYSTLFSTSVNNGNTFKQVTWLGCRNDVANPDAWRLIGPTLEDAGAAP